MRIKFNVSGDPKQLGRPKAKIRYDVQPQRAETYWDSVSLQDWCRAVDKVGRQSMARMTRLLEGPLLCSLEFHFVRPVKHIGANGVKPDFLDAMPTNSQQRLHLLSRAVAETLSGVVYHTDAQIVGMASKKLYASSYGCSVTIVEVSARDVDDELNKLPVQLDLGL